MEFANFGDECPELVLKFCFVSKMFVVLELGSKMSGYKESFKDK